MKIRPIFIFTMRYHFMLLFAMLAVVACSETSEIEAGKSAFALHGELEDCLADSVNIYETDGFAYHQIKSTPLIKSGSSATFRFSGKVPQKGFYLIGTSLNNLTPLILGGEEEIKLVGKGTNFSRSTQLLNSPQNENYAKLKVQVAKVNRRTDSIMQMQARLYVGEKTPKRQKEELYQAFQYIRNEQAKFRDSLKKADPYLAKIADMSLFPIFEVENNLQKYPNALKHFANEYFYAIDFKSPELNYMFPLRENVITYTRTLCAAQENFIGKDSVFLFLDNLLDKAPKDSRTYRLLLSGIMQGLSDQESQFFPKYAQLYAKQYPQEKAINAENSQKFGKITETEKQKQQFAKGSVPPEINLPSPEGETVKLSALLGQYVLLDFWGSEFIPSRRQIPYYVHLYKRFHGRGLEIVSVGIEQDKNAWLKTIREEKMTWKHASDVQYWQSPIVETYLLKSLPSNYLLDKEGKIIAKNIYGKDLERKLEGLMIIPKKGEK